MLRTEDISNKLDLCMMFRMTCSSPDGKSVTPDNTAELLSVRENCRELEIERDKYREVLQDCYFRIVILSWKFRWLKILDEFRNGVY